MTCNNPELDLVNMNAYIKFIYSIICSQDIECKQNYDGRNDKQNDGQTKSNIAPLFQSRAIMSIKECLTKQKFALSR